LPPVSDTRSVVIQKTTEVASRQGTNGLNHEDREGHEDKQLNFFVCFVLAHAFVVMVCDAA
jgi:hypothetical protein